MIRGNGKLTPEREELVRLVSERAQSLFETGQLMCSEAVLTVLNRGLSGGLDDDLAIRLASTLPQGLGDSGCTCGALSGGALGLGLFLGRGRPGAKDRNQAMAAANALHNQFKSLFGSTCCRVLTHKVKQDPKAHVEQCAQFTAVAAETAARVLLDKRPQLANNADWGYLRQRHSKVGAKLVTFLNLSRN